MITSKDFVIQPGATVVIEDSPNELTTYANLVGLLFGTEEVLFHFALRTPNDPNRGVGVAKIYVTLPHAKRMLKTLSDGIEGIEKLIGEIVADPGSKIPPELLQQLQQGKTET